LKKGSKLLIVLVGPTASGKTDTAIRLAKHFNAEIISADSRQFYREIPIGTAAPGNTQLSAVPHHFIGHLSIGDEYNVSRFETDVIGLLEKKFNNHKYMILTGGSGLYIDAVCKGIDELPDPDPAVRKELSKLLEEKGISGLQEKLALLDPEYWEVVDRDNPKRLMRAIEVCIQTGKNYSGLRLNNPKPRNFKVIKIGLDIPRPELNERINKRTELMLEAGWLEEARSVFHLRYLNALNTVGFKELFACLDGSMDLALAIEKIKTSTRRYAKRQMTWFRKDKEIKWFPAGTLDEMIDFIEKEKLSEQD
jgi:tRNA dimethylallyltransferase